MLIERNDEGPSELDSELDDLRAAQIPLNERCPECGGTGRVIFMNCDPGPNRYCNCFACNGSGKKTPQEKSVPKNAPPAGKVTLTENIESRTPALPASRVFTIQGAQPEVLAYAMAKYSRSSLSIADSIREISSQKAAEFLNTFYFAYGHRSIADQAHVPLAVEDISILAAIEVLDEQRWDGQERSTRYQDFSKPRYYVPVGASALTASEEQAYRRSMATLYGAYAELSRLSIEDLKTKNPRPEGMAEAQYDRTIKARAFDIARYLLPMATLTSLGQVTSARSLEAQISRLGASDYEELQRLAMQMKDAVVNEPGLDLAAARTDAPALPTLVKYSTPSQYAINLRKAIRDSISEGLGKADLQEEPPNAPDKAQVDLITFRDLREEAIATLIYEHTNHPMRQILQVLRHARPEFGESILETARQARGAHDEVARAFRCGQGYCFDIWMDIGGMRDLHRHRRCVQIRQAYSLDLNSLNCSTPIGASDAGLTVYTDAIAKVAQEIQALEHSFWERAATLDSTLHYLLPLGQRCRFLMKMDLAELNYIAELRTGPAGHPSYRHAAWDMYQAARRHAQENSVPLDIFEGWKVTDPNQPVDLLRR
jgi:thymidylate synthase ThyX